MIVRDGRTERNLGPAPAQVSGLAAVNTIALATEVYVAPVERRYLTAVELAAIHEQEPVEKPAPNHHYTLTTERAQSMARTRSTRKDAGVPQPRRQVHSDEALWEAIRSTGGNIAAASRRMGQDHMLVRDRVRRRRASGLVPYDVRRLIEDFRYQPRTHSAETKALIAVRMREHRARMKAAA